jgi:hypothetical protein
MQIKNYAYTAVKVKVKVRLTDSKAQRGVGGEDIWF